MVMSTYQLCSKKMGGSMKRHEISPPTFPSRQKNLTFNIELTASIP